MEQINLFSGSKPFKVDKPIRLIELFAGIGAQAKALERMGVEFEHYRICEFDKYAVASYNAVHGTNFATSDITKITADDLAIVDTDTYCYLCCYSFPCQDLSLAGNQKLMAKGSGTRSSLLWEVERLLDECTELPQVLLMENVTQVHGKKNADSFRQWCDKLESLGYKNYWEDLNAKDFGVPQSRNRTFMVSVLGDYTYEFPEGFPLKIRLKDVLEDEVDEKYYLSSIANEKLFRHKNKIVENDTPEISNTIHAGYFKMGGRDQQYIKEEPCVKQIANLMPSKTRENPNQGKLYDKEGLCPTLGAMQGGNRQPFITVREATKKGYAEAVEGDSINLEQPNSKTRRGRVGHGVAQTLTTTPQQAVVEPNVKRVGNIYPSGSQNGNIYDSEGISPTLLSGETSTKGNGGIGSSNAPKIIEPMVWDGFNQRVRADSSTVGTLTQNCGADLKRNGQGIISFEQGLRIRKLTPKECWRLMGFTDADFEKTKYYTEQEVSTLNLRSSKKHKDLPLNAKVERVSDTQLYKQAGNSIVVDVLIAIFSKLF